MKTTSIGVASFFLAGVCSAQAPVPKNGFVPDKQTAIRIAEAVLTPIYGEKDVKAGEPYQAELHGGIWIVRGTTCNPSCGGEAEIHIKKQTGEIISYTHFYL